MEEEIFIEESNPRRSKIIIICLIIFVSICFVGFLILKSRYTLTLEPIRVEAGDKVRDDIQFYVANKVIDESDYTLYLDDIVVNDGIYDTIGEYSYKVKYKNIVKEGKFIVEDTTPPSVETKDLIVGTSEDYNIEDFVIQCDDYSKPCNVLYKDESDATIHKKAGSYDFKIVVKDKAGNKITKTVRLTSKKGYNSEKPKKNDLKIAKVDPDYNDWDGEVLLRYSEGILEDHLDHDDKYDELLEIASDDMSSYLPFEYFGYNIEEQELVYLYNKYNYIVAVTVRVKLSNGEYIYLDK